VNFVYWIWKNRRAVNTIIATILLIAITTGGGIVVYAIFSSTMNTTQQKTQVNFEDMALYRSSYAPKMVFTVTLKNAGNKPLTLLTVKLDNETTYTFPSVNSSNPLEPGRCVSAILTPPTIHKWYVVGNCYNVLVYAKAVDKSSYSHSTNVLCRGEGPAMLSFEKAYGGVEDDEAYALVQTHDGGYAIAGYTYSFGVGYTDAWLIKTNLKGSVLWNETYGGPGPEEAHAIIQNDDGGFTFAGTEGSSGLGFLCGWLARTGSDGNVLWSQAYGLRWVDYTFAMIKTNDGGYALAGFTSWFGLDDKDFWLIKTDSNGNMLWNTTYGGALGDEARSLIQTSDGGYALVGTTYSFGAGSGDFWLVKTDSVGNLQWNQTYGGANDDYAYSIIQTGDGGYALAGYTDSFGAGGRDFWLVKTDSAGNIQWNQTYGGTGYDEARSLIRTGDGGYAIVGYTESFGAGYADGWLIKTDSSGNVLWDRTYGGASDDFVTAIIEADDGGYAMAGYTKSWEPSGYNFWLIKTDDEGY